MTEGLAGAWLREHDAGAHYQCFIASDLGNYLSRLQQSPSSQPLGHVLAFLAREMVSMNESKNREAASFRRWLGTYVGLPLQNWHLKTIVDRYWQWPWEDLQRALRRNRGRMTRDPESRDALTKIRQECEESCGRLKPLAKHIEATDRLIDLIVYQLYKLTEQEVAIVEGGTG